MEIALFIVSYILITIVLMLVVKQTEYDYAVPILIAWPMSLPILLLFIFIDNV